MTKLLSHTAAGCTYVAAALFVACGGSTAPAASPPPPSASTSDGASGASAAADAGSADQAEVKTELTRVDSALADLNKRMGTARDDTKADLAKQLAVLQKRDDDLKAQLREGSSLAGDKANSLRDRIHQGLLDLDHDVKQFGDRIKQ